MKSTPRLKINTILGEAGYGVTRPLHVIADDDREYILKTRYNHVYTDLDRNISCEFICYKIANILKLNIVAKRIAIIEIDERVVQEAVNQNRQGAIDNIVLENIRKSIGSNLGIEFLENHDQAFDIDNEIFKSSVVHLDNIIMNADRTIENPNVLADNNHRNKFVAIDFGQGLSNTELLADIITGQYVCNCNDYANNNFLYSENDYIFKSKADSTRVAKKFSFNVNELKNIFADIPSDWTIAMQCKDEIIDTIESRIGNNKIFSKKKMQP